MVDSYKYKSIREENLPCWYEIGWKDGKLIWRIAEDFLKKVDFVLHNEIVNDFKRKFSLFADWRSDFRADWGFEGCLKFQGIENGFYIYFVEPPIVKKQLERPCEHCFGKPKERIFDIECSFCSGSGKQESISWRKVTMVSATHTILTDFLRSSREAVDIKTEKSQLLTVSTITHNGLGGGSLGGTYSRVLIKWLEVLAKDLPKNHEIVFKSVIQAMEQAYDQMWGMKDFNVGEFGARLTDRNGRLIIDCLGNACGLGPAGGRTELDEGYEFDCHNTDSAEQQFTLLVGLGALHDLIRSQIKEY